MSISELVSRGVEGVAVDHAARVGVVLGFVTHSRGGEPRACDDPLDISLLLTIMMLQGGFRALVEDPEGTIVAIRTEWKIVMTIADVHERCHLEVDRHLRLIRVLLDEFLS